MRLAMVIKANESQSNTNLALTDNTFFKTKVALAVVGCLTYSVVMGNEQTEVIEVKGVKSSLTQSLFDKKEAKSLVDSIAAEELGRFPDDNVADSLSHIAGVTVSRTRGGEAQYVNIRGLGPEFSIVTLNNRILATDDGGRNFAFDVIPSEMINGADVWKTVQAKNIEGSIGGAVNLKSARAFDNNGQHATVSITGDYNDLSEEIGTKLVGVYSNTFADDTLGFIVGVSRSAGTQRADDMFDNFFFGVEEERSYDVNGNGSIESNEQNLVIPGSYALGSYASDFTRTGLTSSLQWQATEKLSFVADVLVTRLQADANGYTQSFYMVDESEDQSRLSNIQLDGNLIVGMDISDVTMEVVTLDDHRTVDTSLFGVAGEYIVNDQLVLAADIYQSRSSRDSGGKNTFVVAGAPGAHTGSFSLNEGGLPDYIPTWTQGRTSDDFGNNDFAPHWAARDGSDIEDRVNGLSLDADYAFSDGILQNIETGVNYTSRRKTNTAFDNYDLGACNYCGYPFTFAQVGAEVVLPFPFDNFFDGESGDFPRSFPVFSIPAYGQGLSASDGLTLVDYNGNERVFGENESALWEPVLNPVNSYDIEENTSVIFIQANFEGENWFANAGVRWVKTDVTADYSYNSITSIDIVDPNSPNPAWDVVYTDSADQQAKGGYSKILPAFNVGMYITDTLLLRGAAAQSLSRPTLDQLAPLTTDNARSGVFEMNISGNPDIEPVFSNQLDIALEWYFDKSSMAAVSIFYKDLDGFITPNTERYEIAGEMFNVSQPINGDSAEVLGFELGLQKFFDNGFGVTASYAYTDSSTIVDGQDAGALIGVADTSYSLSLIYEKDNISAQVALDYTGELEVDPYSPLGEGYHTYMTDVSMVTASFTYDITANAQVFIEGNNLLNESNRTFQGRSDLPGSIQIYGRTMKLGARYVF